MSDYDVAAPITGYYAILSDGVELAAAINEDGTATIDGTYGVAESVMLRRRRPISLQEYIALLARPRIDPSQVPYESALVAADGWSGITSAAEAERVNDLRLVLRAHIKSAKERLDGLKAPFREQLNRIEDQGRPLITRLETAAGRLRALVTAWLVDEQARLASEQAAEALLSTATAEIDGAIVEMPAHLTAPPKPQLRGAVKAPATGLRTYRRAEVVDYTLAAEHYRNHPDVIAALTKIASADARRGTQEIPGFVIIIEEKAV